MRNILITFLLLSILFLIPQGLSAQNNFISIKKEYVTINPDSSFTKNVSVLLKRSQNNITFPVFYDSELEDVSDVKVYLKKGNRFKILKNPVIEETNINIDYITSQKVKSISVPPNTEAKITYTVKCKELMYFSDLRLFSYDNIDTLKYRVTIPESFHLSHDIIYQDSLKYYMIDSIESDKVTTWNIEVVPVKVEPNPLIYFGIYRNLKVPLIRTIVVPSEYKGIEKEYINDWYHANLEPQKGLDSTAIQKIEELTNGMRDPMIIMDTLYNYVRTNFKYVAIEIGMGAFVPSHVNEVFLTKQGDCKDLSNFLSEALKYKGIESHVALAATFNHISDCNFPSLSSANHVVCLAYIDGRAIILDPTDPIHIPETPVQSIQERTLLIINQEGGEFYNVDGFHPQQNAINYDIQLKIDSNFLSMEGTFKAKYKGISGNYLRREYLDAGDESKTWNQKEHYESIFGNQLVSGIKIFDHDNLLVVEGELLVNGKIIDDKNSRFLFIDFLPRLIETVNRETLLEGTYLGNSVYKKVKLMITLDKPIDSFDSIEKSFSNDGISMNIKITNPSYSVIECSYEFVLDHIFIDKENVDIVNEIIKSFKKVTNEPVLLKIES